MKRLPQIDRFFTAVCSIIIVSLLFNSCERDSLENDSFADFKSDQSLSARRGLVRPTAILLEESTNEPYTDCVSSCIEPDSGIYYYTTETQEGGNGANVKEVAYAAYNTETHFVLEVIYNITAGNSNAHADITITVNGTATLYGDMEPGSKILHSVPLAGTWTACEVVNFNIYQEGLGNPIEFNNSYSLIGLCGSCDESFDYVLNDDGSYTFTYMSEEDLSNAEVNFTCPHIVDFQALDGKTYSVNPGNGNGSPTVLTWNGDILACEALTFTLSFNADCDQNNANFANLFTDFKVNGISKKGDLENIVFDCDN